MRRRDLFSGLTGPTLVLDFAGGLEGVSYPNDPPTRVRPPAALPAIRASEAGAAGATCWKCGRSHTASGNEVFGVAADGRATSVAKLVTRWFCHECFRGSR